MAISLGRIRAALLPGRRRKDGESSSGQAVPVGAVNFVTDSQEMQAVGPGEVLYAPQASTRLRVLLPAAEIARRRKVFLVPLHAMLRGGLDLRAAAAVVLAKLPTGRVAKFDAGALRHLEEWMGAANRETRLFADLSDDYEALAETFRAPVLAEYQRLLIRQCALVVPTQAFADRLAAAGAGRVRVIEDPYESRSTRPARELARSGLRLCWFGNIGPPNADFLRACIVALASDLRSQSIVLEMVAGPGAAATVRQIDEHARSKNPDFSVTFTEWSLERVEQALDRADLVLLPHQLDMPWAHVKSHNRLVKAIRAGRFAIATPIPSYRELAPYAWLGDSLADGVHWAMTHPREVAQRLDAGQTYVETRFSPAVIGEKWMRALMAN